MNNELENIIERCRENAQDLINMQWNLMQLIEKLNEYKVIEQDIGKLKKAKDRVGMGLTQYQDEFDFYLARILGEL